MDFTGSVEINYQIGNSKYRFPAAIIPVVLGLDFLRKFGAVINLGNGEMTFNSKDVAPTPVPNRIPKSQGTDPKLLATLATMSVHANRKFM